MWGDDKQCTPTVFIFSGSIFLSSPYALLVTHMKLRLSFSSGDLEDLCMIVYTRYASIGKERILFFVHPGSLCHFVKISSYQMHVAS